VKKSFSSTICNVDDETVFWIRKVDFVSDEKSD